MGVPRFRWSVLLAWVLLVAGIATAGSACAQSDRPPIFDYVPGGGPRAKSDADAASLLAQVNQLYQEGKYAEATPLAERYAKVIQTRHGTESTEYALALNNLALLLQSMNRPADAELLYRRALTIDERSSGPEHTNVAVTLSNLALLLHAGSRLAEAEPLMRR